MRLSSVGLDDDIKPGVSHVRRALSAWFAAADASGLCSVFAAAFMLLGFEHYSKEPGISPK